MRCGGRPASPRPRSAEKAVPQTSCLRARRRPALGDCPTRVRPGRSLWPSRTPASNSSAHICRDNQVVALGPMPPTRDRFRVWKNARLRGSRYRTCCQSAYVHREADRVFAGPILRPVPRRIVLYWAARTFWFGGGCGGESAGHPKYSEQAATQGRGQDHGDDWLHLNFPVSNESQAYRSGAHTTMFATPNGVDMCFQPGSRRGA
jgi:hypothetical protein